MVYRDVFRRIAEEESQYAIEGEEHLPDFGMSVTMVSLPTVS